MKTKTIGILVCMLLLIGACFNGTISKTISAKENFVSANFNKQKNYDYKLGDLYICFSQENALTIINNVPLDGSTYYADKEWICNLEIDYSTTCGFDIKFDVTYNVQAYLGNNAFFLTGREFEYIGTDCPPDVHETETKTIPKGEYLVDIFIFVRVGVYYNISGHWEFYKVVEDSEKFYCDIKIINEIPSCFPPGTKITMADGSYKNIEDINIGEQVLGYDTENNRYTSWTVRILDRPINTVCNINNGLLRLTPEHPIYVSKSNGMMGSGAVEPLNAMMIPGEILPINVGDKIFTSDETWITINNISFEPNPIQLYNIVSYTGTKTYFANDILVYEDFIKPTWIIAYIFKNSDTPIQSLIAFLHTLQFLP